METFNHRLQRFQNNPPNEFIQTILNSINNFYIPELAEASKSRLSNILILGIQSIVETISENIFLKKGVEGFKFYLENFVDSDMEGFRFSEIADELNDWRNIIAHQYISKLGHSFGYDYNITVGYRIDGTIIILNPSIFFEQFNNAFMGAFKKEVKTKLLIWNYKQLLSNEQMEEAKKKFIQKYTKK